MNAKIATLTIAAVISAPAFAQENQAQNFEQQLFTSHTPVNAIELSQTEMKETEGSAVPIILPILIGGNIGAWGNHYDSYQKTGQPASVSSTLKATGVGMATGASMYGAGRGVQVVKNLKFDGPSKGFKYDNGRFFGIRHNSKPVFRVDKHPNPSPTKWHIHIAPDIKAHRPWYAPWKKY